MCSGAARQKLFRQYKFYFKAVGAAAAADRAPTPDDEGRTMADEPKQSHMIPVEIEAEMKKSYLDYAVMQRSWRAWPFPTCATA